LNYRSIRLLGYQIFAAVTLSLLFEACGGQPKPTTRDVQAWRKLGSWSGHGPISTEPFISDTGTLRLQWETRNEAAPGKGVFQITVYSDVSGRPLVLAVDHRGIGSNTVYVNEDPRPFYLGIESADLEWSVAVDEAIPATATDPVRP
jgi:hypothetical protein